MKHNTEYRAGAINGSDERLRRLISIALFSALSYICLFVFRFNVSFLTFDAKDAVMTVGALYFGPLSGLIMAAAVSLLEFLTIGDTGPWGLLMDFLSSASFAVIAGLIYKLRRSLSGAIIGLASSVVSMTGVMMLANLLITPLYMGVSRGDVATLIPTLLLPFNFTKAMLNAAIVLLLYKPITLALSRARLIKRPAGSLKFGRRELILSSVAVAIIVACTLVFVLKLNGSFEII